MIPNNNLSVLPWYRSIEQQNARKWWVYNRIFPLYVRAGHLPPFQILKTHSNSTTLSWFRLRKSDGTLVGTFTQDFAAQLTRVAYTSLGYDVLIYGGQLPLLPELSNGQYYAEMRYAGVDYCSEIFTVVNDIEPYLKIEWWDIADFVMDGGRIVYKYANNTQFKNELYLPATIAKPEYIFEEEGENRDGYFFPTKMISEKRYRFSFFAPEYLLDVMRLIRLSDYVRISKGGDVWLADSFLLSPEWEAEGDIAVANVEFETGMVAKKIGFGVALTTRGDFNNDYNNDFNNN